VIEKWKQRWYQRLNTLVIKPGEALAIVMPADTDETSLIQISDLIAQTLPDGIHAFVIAGDVELKVIREQK
jgi:hypothetical protein